MNGSLNAGERIYELAKKIFPLNRSITGDGVRQTLEIINNYISSPSFNTAQKQDLAPKFKIHEIPSGTNVFDWTIPKEWKINAAYIEDEHGNHIIDMKNNNLHVLGYSIPIDKWVDLEELKKYIYTQPDQPDVIPYVTSYYKERFGFCMSKRQLSELPDGNYHMYIDSQLFNGNLTYADLIIPGKTTNEVMITSYTCHPSMANNECSGPALLAELIRYVSNMKQRKYTYRFLLNPETIGSIAYISQNLQHLKSKLIAGIVLSCVGDVRDYSIVHSRYGNTLADKSLSHILKYCPHYTSYSYLDRGSDERQYNAPGVDLPVVTFCRSKFGTYPEYHTSADNMKLISPSGFQGSYDVMTKWVDAIESNEKYTVTVLCEPQLGKRGLYPTISQKNSYDTIRAMTNFIAYADGKNDLFDICNIINEPIEKISSIAEKLMQNGLIGIHNCIFNHDEELG